MKKGILQRVSKNWEEAKNCKIKHIIGIYYYLHLYSSFLVPPIEVKIKEEPQPSEVLQPIQPVIEQTEPVRVIHSEVIKQKLDVKKVHRESLITERRDYSEKFRFNVKSPTTAASLLDHAYENVSPSIASPTLHSSMPSGKLESKKKEKFAKPTSPTSLTNGKEATVKRLLPSITILERHCYDKGPSLPKQIKVEPVEESLLCAIQSPQPLSSIHCSNNLNVPIKQSDVADTSQITMGLEEFEVTVAQKADKLDAKPRVQSLKPQPEPKDSQNFNRVNNKINIIFKLGDNSKSLRKNIILHRRTPKFQKITIKDKNKTQPDGVLSSSSIDTQTEIVQRCAMNISNSKPLCDEPTGK